MKKLLKRCLVEVLSRELDDLLQASAELLQDHSFALFLCDSKLLALLSLRNHALNGGLDDVLSHEVVRSLYDLV